MLGEKCIYCHNPLKEYDFYLEKPEGKICSHCIIKFSVLVSSGIKKQDTPKNHLGFGVQPPDSDPHLSLSHPSNEQALLLELETLLT